MKIVKIELAGISDILYHSTTAETLLDMLKENKVRMSVDMGTEPTRTSINKKSSRFRPYFFSLSRIKYGGYSRNIREYDLAVVEMDGQKLKQNYAGEAVDYWGESYRNPEIYDAESRLKKNENEDRIYGSKPFLEPLSRYIKSVHVMLAPEYLQYRNDWKSMSSSEVDKAQKQEILYTSIQKFALVHALKAYFYSDYKDIKLLNTRKAKTELCGIYDVKYILQVNEVFEAILTKDYTKLSENADRLLLYADYPHNLEGLKTDISNAKKTLVGRTAIDKMVDNMRRFKIRDIQGIEELFKLHKSDRYK